MFASVLPAQAVLQAGGKKSTIQASEEAGFKYIQWGLIAAVLVLPQAGSKKTKGRGYKSNALSIVKLML